MGWVQLPERAVRWFDDRQQTRWWLAHPIGTLRKYTDDRGSALAALVTFQVFLGMLPLLVLVLTLLGGVLAGSESLREAVLDSAAAQLPIVGERLEADVRELQVDGPWLVVSALGLVWTATGIYNALQQALNQVWNVEGVDHQGFLARQWRSLVLFVLVIAAAVSPAVAPVDDVLAWAPSPLAGAIETVVGVLIASALLLAVFRIVVSPSVRLGRLAPAALLAGLMWELLQRVGAYLVTERLTEAEDLYGGIGFVIVALFWINLLARAAIFANEWAVVSWRELWPRRIAQPPLTRADREVLASLVRNERRRPEQHIEVTFDEDTPAGGAPT